MIKENIILVIFTLIHNRFSKKIKNRANSVDVNIALKQNKEQNNNKNYIDEKQCSTIPVL